MNKQALKHLLLCQPNKLRSLTWLAWLLTFALAFLMQKHSVWSDRLQKAMALGFDSEGSGPITGLTLAKSLSTFRESLETNDIENLQAILRWDMGFLAAYSVLLICLAFRNSRKLWRFIIITLVCSTAALDACENWLALDTLGKFSQNIIPESNGVQWASAGKWIFFFSTCLLLAISEWRRPLRGGFKSGIRITICLLLGAGALTGLSWLIFQHAIIIENGFGFSIVALILFPLWLWNPDDIWSQP